MRMVSLFKKTIQVNEMLNVEQGFRWAIENDEWEARVNSIKPLFEGQTF